MPLRSPAGHSCCVLPTAHGHASCRRSPGGADPLPCIAVSTSPLPAPPGIFSEGLSHVGCGERGSFLLWQLAPEGQGLVYAIRSLWWLWAERMEGGRVRPGGVCCGQGRAADDASQRRDSRHTATCLGGRAGRTQVWARGEEKEEVSSLGSSDASLEASGLTPLNTSHCTPGHRGLKTCNPTLILGLE